MPQVNNNLKENDKCEWQYTCDKYAHEKDRENPSNFNMRKS